MYYIVGPMKVVYEKIVVRNHGKMLNKIDVKTPRVRTAERPLISCLLASLKTLLCSWTIGSEIAVGR